MIVLLYLLAIVTANLLVVTFGPAVTIVNAFLFIGFDLAARDKLHDRWRGDRLVLKMGLLIGAGSLISYTINSGAGRIGLASMLAFGAAAMVDSLMYHFLRNKKYLVRSNGSNVPSALVDSLVFPTVAFGAFLPAIVLGQFLAKVFGGFMWSLIINRFRTEDKHDGKFYKD